MAIPSRQEVPTALTWDLQRIFKSDADWTREFTAVQKETRQLKQLNKDFTQSGRELYAALSKILAVKRRLDKVYVYASLSSDVDTANRHYLSCVAQAQALGNEFAAATAFVNPAILQLSAAKLAQLRTQEPRLVVYAHFLAQIRQKQGHTLPAAQEKLVAGVQDALGVSANTFNVLTNSDMEYGYVQDEQGQMRQLTDGLYSLLIQSPKRRVRKNAFDVLYASYGQFENSLASTLSGVVKAHNYNARVHHYPSARAAALAANHVPTVVYDTLIKEVHAHLPLFHRYVALRKKVLALPDLQMWDMYVPLTGKPALTYTFAQAKQEALKALAPLGQDYLQHVKYIFDNRVIDPVESKHKVSGAYSGGCYDTDPYELINWENDLDSLYTLVHETGHSVHSWYTRHNQPYVYGDYPIFVAEIASTTNENILTEYFLNHIKDAKTRAFILNYYLDSFKVTLFRQTQFAEFEQFIHEADAKGQPLTADKLNDFYGKLNQRYYGPAVVPGGDIAKEWARIPHFYYNFYVYQYATGFAAANVLAKKIVYGGRKERDAYLSFLKAGSSDYPLAIMKKAGVDMSKGAYLEEAFQTFAQRLQELDTLLAKMKK